MQVEENKSLQRYNTLKINAVAAHFCSVETDQDIRNALQFAQDKQLAVKVLGGGSNVVMSDVIQGLTLHMDNHGIETIRENTDSVWLKVAAGENWHEFVMRSLDLGFYGLENLALIPGSVGAAPVQNIGAYGVEVESFIESVEAYSIKTAELVSFRRDSCGFAYRESIFKNEVNGEYVIAHVIFRLSKTPRVRVEYTPLNQLAAQQGEPTPKQLAQWVIDVRNEKLPDPAVLPNAGSFFKNPVVSLARFEALITQYPKMPSFRQVDGVKIPAGWLIDQLGLKGHCFGKVMVHDKQALVLVNQGGQADDVIDAAAAIKQKVQHAYGISLEQEPRVFQ